VTNENPTAPTTAPPIILFRTLLPGRFRLYAFVETLRVLVFDWWRRVVVGIDCARKLGRAVLAIREVEGQDRIRGIVGAIREIECGLLSPPELIWG